MNWFSDAWKKLTGSVQEDTAPPTDETKEAEPINMAELSEGAQREIVRLQKQLMRTDITLQEIKRANEMMDAVVEQDRREREFAGTKRDWSDPAARRGAREAQKVSLSGMTQQELNELKDRIDREAEYQRIQTEQQLTKRWGKEAGQRMGQGESPRPVREIQPAAEPTEAERMREGRRRAA